ncbi:hypothetical protein QE364_000507 [Nocardioides zeae]|uniref:Uncharacterized protein n=1 Tax=Nocardioides zeae TaxID=1457234 RepID=A0ACC6IDS5_9ACTN|nr:hypothetical protein [Nocardioides zeae]MDR6175891.1 hypothetical protein [Nocardioides zeae]MDR6208819.1 hypothetical protein [Nocardioides zeae]
MRMLRSPFAHLAVALLLGAAAAAVVVLRMAGAEPFSVPEPGDRVEAAVAALADGPVYVSPDGRSMLSERDEAALEELIEDRDLPVRIVVWQPSTKAGYDHPTLSPAQQILDGLTDPTILVLWQGPDDSSVATTDGWNNRFPDYEESFEREPTFLGDAGLSLTEWLGSVPPDILEERSTSDYYGGPGGGIAFGLLVGLPIVAAVWVLAGLVRMRAGRGFLARAPRRPTSRRPVELRKRS